MTRARLLAVFIAAIAVAGILVANRNGNSGPAVPKFVDDTTASGVAQVYDGEFPFFVGGGVAAFDCSGDGMPDLFMAGGARTSALYVNHSTRGGELSFSRKSSSVTDMESVTGAYPLEINGDGVTDLVVLRRGANAVLEGTGDCGSRNVTTSLGLDPGADWTTAFSATWEKNATLPTMFFGNYLTPDTYDCADSLLWRPTGETYTGPIPIRSHCTLSALFSDWGRTGNTDLRLSNDRNYDRHAREQLWRVRSSQPPSEYGTSDGWRDLTIWGMGIASQDVNGDGLPEIFLTSQGDNKLQQLVNGAKTPTYGDIALRLGVTAQRPYVGDSVLPSTAWHPEFGDVNNDGMPDLFVTKGNVDAQVDYASADPNDLLIARSNGTFVEKGDASGVASTARSRGAVVVDLNMDGLLDIVVMNRRVPAQVLRNVGTGTADHPVSPGNWVQFRLHQKGPNTSAIGAWVEVRTPARTWTHEVTVGGGHASGESGWIHAGIGSNTQAEVRVTYPGGTPGPWMKVDANGFYDLTSGSGTPTPWVPAD